MNLQKLEREVPFDQFSRQFQITQILQTLKSKDTPFMILDVGGYKGRTADFLDSDKVTVVDLFDVRDKNYIRGSALDLPFEDNSFDFVLSFDVLEHIPAADRKKFVDECSRVAKKGIIICAPNKTRTNEITENKLNLLYKRLHHKPHKWLKEHIDYGIPSFDVIERMVQKKGLHTSRFFSNKTELWFAMQQAIFTNSKFPLASQNLTRLNEYYNKYFKYDGGGSVQTSYRQILCGFKSSKDAALISNKMKNLNEPIDIALELELKERINDYYVTLLTKTTQLAKNYEGLYEFHKNESESHQKTTHHLRNRLQKYEKLLPTKILAKAKLNSRRTV